DSAVDRGMVHRYSTLLHQFFDMAIAQRVGHIPSHARENNILHKMGALEADHHCSPSLDSRWVREEVHTPDGLHMKICDTSHERPCGDRDRNSAKEQQLGMKPDSV